MCISSSASRGRLGNKKKTSALSPPRLQATLLTEIPIFGSAELAEFTGIVPFVADGDQTVKGPFNDLPRLPFQIGNCLLRSATFLTHLRRRLREQ